MLVIVDEPTFTGCHIRARPVGTLIMVDEKGEDEKILAVPQDDPRFAQTLKLHDLTTHWQLEIAAFFRTYKELQGVQTEVRDWHDVAEAWRIIEGRARALPGATLTTPHPFPQSRERSGLVMTNTGLGMMSAAEAMARLTREDAIGQLRRRDGAMAQLGSEGSERKLDWVEMVSWLLAHPAALEQVEREAAELIARGVRHVIWAGMGGSVLSVRVLMRAWIWTRGGSHPSARQH